MKKVIKKAFLILNLLAVLMLLVAYMAPVVNPVHFVVPSYFGLVFIYVVALNLLFVIGWILFSKWYFLISLLVLLSGYKVLDRSIPFRTNESEITSPSSLRVMSFNVRVFNRYGWTSKGSADHVAEFIRRESPDIVCLQEFGVSRRDSKRSETAVLKLFTAWKYHHIKYGSYSENGFQQGLAIFSKYPILRTGILPNGDADNFTVYADIEKGTKVVRIFNCHLQSIDMAHKENLVYELIQERTNPTKVKHEMGLFRWHMNKAYKLRAVQAQTHREYIDASPFPVIVCGDFNDTPVSYAYKKIKGDLVDAYCDSGNGNGSTYNGHYPLLRIDYIFFDKRLSSSDFKRHKVDYSDHFPISCYIEFNE